MTEDQLELKAKKIIIRCTKRMCVIPELFNFAEFWDGVVVLVGVNVGVVVGVTLGV